MDQRDHDAKQIGQVLHDAFGPAPHNLDVYKRQLRRKAQTSSGLNRHKNLRWGIAAAAFCVGLFLFVGFLLRTTTEKVRYKIGNDQPFENKEWINNQSEQSLPIVFENGSRFQLGRKSTARMVRADSEQVILDLNNGRVEADIRGNGKTKWMIRAGAHKVNVLGTTFFVDFSSATNELKVNVIHGKVLIRGAQDDEEVVLRAGHQLLSQDGNSHVSVAVPIKKQTVASQSHKASKGHDDVVSDLDETQQVDNHVSGPSTTPLTNKIPDKNPRVREPANKLIPPWRQHINTQNWKAAIETMDPQSVGLVCENEKLESLWKLANTARHEGKSETAILFWQSIRKRFKQTPRAQTATYLVAKTKLDLQANLREAIQWFHLYRTESPNGPLAEEALGHLMEVSLSLGRPSEAVGFARDYLSHYGNGVFSRRANYIIGSAGRNPGQSH